jgi:hypothetical protein
MVTVRSEQVTGTGANTGVSPESLACGRVTYLWAACHGNISFVDDCASLGDA